MYSGSIHDVCQSSAALQQFTVMNGAPQISKRLIVLQTAGSPCWCVYFHDHPILLIVVRYAFAQQAASLVTDG